VNKIKYLAAALVAVAGLGFQQAQASLMFQQYFVTNGPIGNPTQDTQYLINNFGQPSDLVSLFKENNDGTTAGLYGKYFTVTMTTSSLWTVSWNLTGTGFTLDSVLIKDGATRNNQQLYGFYTVSADQAIIGSGTVDFNGTLPFGMNRKISFVEFFGSPITSVPDGGSTVMLLGVALGALGVVRGYLTR